MFAGLPLSKIAGMIGIKGFALIGIALAMGIQTWRLSSAHAEIETQRNLVAAERASHAVTRNSVQTLEGEIDKLMEAAKAREAEYKAGKASAEHEAKRLAGLARGSDAKVKRLFEMAEQGGSCPVSPELLRELEGL